MRESSLPPWLPSSPTRASDHSQPGIDDDDGRICESPPPSAIESTSSSLDGWHPASPESPRWNNAFSSKSIINRTMMTMNGIIRIAAHRRPAPSYWSRVGTIVQGFLLPSLNFGIWALFAVFVAALFLHKMHDDFLYPQLRLMVFRGANRDEKEVTYYHRVCTREDFLARNTTLEDLWILPPSSSGIQGTDDGSNVANTKQYAQGAAEHMLIHGVSVYPNLLSDKTSHQLRTWIVKETERRQHKGWHVQNGEHRVSWGFDMNDSYGGKDILHQFWKELATNNPYFVPALEAVLGPDPAVMEFSHITSEYKAIDQGNHPDLSVYESAAKYARSFVPSYSLFIPLQDTTYEMGATQICPGSHLCGGGGEEQCEEFNIAMSGGRPGVERSNSSSSGVWRAGWGALMNSQTMHRGMAHTDPYALDRVVVVITFAPRPNWNRPGQMDTRMLVGFKSLPYPTSTGLGSTYSILWHHWGHTFSDFLRADQRMTEPQKTLRCLGLIKSKGWTHLTTTIMKMANKEIGYEGNQKGYKRFLKDGKFSFLPQSWQGEFDEKSDINVWHAFLLGTLKRTEQELLRINVTVLVLYLSLFLAYDLVRLAASRLRTRRRKRQQESRLVQDREAESESNAVFKSSMLRTLIRIFFGYGLIIILAQLPVRMVNNSNWGKAVRSGKAYQVPWRTSDTPSRSTIPHTTDILWTQRAYASSYLTSYSKVLDFAHPGNAYWKEVARTYADGYAALSPPSQVDFCHSLLDQIQLERRFLVQDTDRYWTKVLDQGALESYCHRELMMASDPLLYGLLEQIDAMKGDIQYGFWRDMAIHERTIPAYLETWEQRLLPRPRDGEKKGAGISLLTTTTIDAKTARPRVALATPFSPVSQKRAATAPFNGHDGKRRHSLPPVLMPEEPVPGVWFEEGDRVFAQYECVNGNDWLPATITAAHPFDATYEVEYEDGETDDTMQRRCLRRHNDGTVGEDAARI